MKENRRAQSWARLPIAAAMVLLVGSQAQAAFTENFSTWVNGTSPNNMSGAGASSNGWTLMRADTYSVAGGELNSASAADTINNKTISRLHGETLSDATRLDLSFSASLAVTNSTYNIWLADNNQNGYGLRATLNADSSVSLSAMEISGNATAFGSAWSSAAATYSGSASYSASGYQRIFMRLEQSAPGASVTLTAWLAGGSYESPLFQMTDAAGIHDLNTLHYAALVLDRTTTSGGVAKMDDITITALAVPEPATAGLTLAGVALSLRRRR